MRAPTRSIAPRKATKASQSDLSSHRTTDVLGVCLLALAAVIVFALSVGQAGLIGEALGGLFRLLFGKGAWGVPLIFTLLGLALLAGRRKIEATRLTWGLFIFFAALLGVFAASRQGEFFDPDVVSASGGYLGAIIGWTFASLIGSAKLIGIGALGMVGVILCANAPLRALRPFQMGRGRRKLLRSDNESERRRVPQLGVVEMNEAPRISPKGLVTGEELSAKAPKTKPRVTEIVPLATGHEIPAPKEGYTLPPLPLLNEPPARPKRTQAEMQQNINTLEGTLEEFNIEANVVEIATGPTITRYEIHLGPGIRVARITALADNIAMDLAASHVRVEAPIPGKSAIGVEVPNAQSTMVTLRELCDSKEFINHPSRLFVALGQDVSGVNKYADLTKMPHLLIGGATNSGKSIGLATIITSLLMRNTPKDLKMVLIDPKRVELSLFDGIPHLMCPVVKDVKEAPGVLRAVWREMDIRYDKFSDLGVRNIDGWNEKATFQERLPYIIVVIDELADLMIQAGAEVETSICRLAQLARATGIHIVIATQRPSVDVITGTIKANIASRIAFSVSSQIDSRTILDQKGAEALVGKGDMLFLPIDASKPTRIQGCYVSEKEIEAVCEHWKQQEKPSYVLNPIQIAIQEREAEMADQESDPLWEDAVRWVVGRGQASTSMIQRKFAIGFQRAARLLDIMEQRGIVGARDGPRPREVLIDSMDAESLFGGSAVARAPIDTDPLD